LLEVKNFSCRVYRPGPFVTQTPLVGDKGCVSPVGWLLQENAEVRNIMITFKSKN